MRVFIIIFFIMCVRILSFRLTIFVKENLLVLCWPSSLHFTIKRKHFFFLSYDKSQRPSLYFMISFPFTAVELAFLLSPLLLGTRSLFGASTRGRGSK